MTISKTAFIFILFFGFQLNTWAQDDDMYFVPKSKEQKKAERKAYEAQPQRSYSYDDIIDFDDTAGVYPDTLYADSLYTDMIDVAGEDEDFTYSRRISRFDEFAFWYPGYYSWYSSYYPWYSGYYPWYGSYYSWADPWYDPWFYGYRGYRNYWRNAFWGWYDPWYTGYYYYGYPMPRPYIVHGGGHHRNWQPPHFSTGRSSLADRRSPNFNNRNRTVNQRNPNMTSGRSRNSGYNASQRFGRSTSTLSVPQSSGSVSTGSRGISNNTGGSFSRSGGFGGSNSGGGSFSGGGSRGGGGGFGGRR